MQKTVLRLKTSNYIQMCIKLGVPNLFTRGKKLQYNFPNKICFVNFASCSSNICFVVQNMSILFQVTRIDDRLFQVLHKFKYYTNKTDAQIFACCVRIVNLTCNIYYI